MFRRTATPRPPPGRSSSSTNVSSRATWAVTCRSRNPSSSRVVIATERPARTTCRHTRPSLGPPRTALLQCVELLPEAVVEAPSPLRFPRGGFGPPPRNDGKSALTVDDRLVGPRDVRRQDRDAHREYLGPHERRCGDRSRILNRAEEQVRRRARRPECLGGVRHADPWPFEIPEIGFEVVRFETEDEFKRTTLEREGRNSHRLLQVCLVRLLGEAGP